MTTITAIEKALSVTVKAPLSSVGIMLTSPMSSVVVMLTSPMSLVVERKFIVGRTFVVTTTSAFAPVKVHYHQFNNVANILNSTQTNLHYF